MLFLFIIASIIILIPLAKWDERSERQAHFADFSKKELATFKPGPNGIIYNDLMLEFYYQYFENPEGEYRYILGFEPAIMPAEDRIFTCVNISKNYNNLDWIKASSKLWIGKLKDKNAR